MPLFTCSPAPRSALGRVVVAVVLALAASAALLAWLPVDAAALATPAH